MNTLFFTEEVRVVENIKALNNERMPQDIINKIERYSKPTKSTIIKVIKIDEKRYLDITLDIAEGSNKVFSQESVEFF